MPSFSIQAALLGLPTPLAQEVQAKLLDLTQKLWDQRQLLLRDDSRLVWAFVTDSLSEGWTQQMVLDELCWSQYIHQYTPYSAMFQGTIPIIKTNLEHQLFAYHPRAHHIAFEYVQKVVIPQYRIAAFLQRHPDPLTAPQKMPWMTTQEQQTQSS